MEAGFHIMRFTQQQFVHDVIRALWSVYRDPQGPLAMTLTFGPAVPRGNPAQEVQSMAVFNLPPTHQVSASLSITTAEGNPARVDGLPVWSLTDPAIVTLDVAADGMSALVKATGEFGITQLTVEVDADLGEGVRSITAVGDIAVVEAEAQVVELTFGTSEPQAPPE